MKNAYHLSTKNKAKSGFTIVEVTLSLAFIGMLIIAIAMILVNIFALYQKGLTVKSINSVGRGLVSELTTTINAAPSIDSTSICNTLATNKTECLKNGAFEYIFQAGFGQRSDQTGRADTVQYYGALCTGKYTYLWNTYQGKRDNKMITLRYKVSTTSPVETLEDFKLVRINDRNYRTCSKILDNKESFNNASGNYEVDISKLPNDAENYIYEEPVQGFLDSADAELYLYELTIFPISQDSVTLRAFFSGTFILATDRGDVNIFRNGDYCNPNANYINNAGENEGGSGSVLDLGSEFNYCAVNRFNFAARTSGNVIK